MHTVIEAVDRPATKVVEEFDGVPVSIIGDVTTEYETVMDHEIKPVWAVDSVVGTALTVKTNPGDNLMVHKALTLAKPGDVLVVDASGYREAGLWGELLSASALAHDVQGTVIDGAIRDVNQIAELEFPVYARAVSPKGTFKSHPGSINVPVTCGGVTVNPGDIVVGDEEGIAVVRGDRATEIAERARTKCEAESKLREQVESGEYIFHRNGYDEQYDRLDIEHAD